MLYHVVLAHVFFLGFRSLKTKPIGLEFWLRFVVDFSNRLGLGFRVFYEHTDRILSYFLRFHFRAIFENKILSKFNSRLS